MMSDAEPCEWAHQHSYSLVSFALSSEDFKIKSQSINNWIIQYCDIFILVFKYYWENIIQWWEKYKYNNVKILQLNVE